MKNSLFETLEQALTDYERRSIQNVVNEGGYASFHRLLDGFTHKMKTFEDDEIQAVKQLLDKAKELFPTPVVFSPSWERIWIELEETFSCKANILQTIPVTERDGEWQIVMDNPHTTLEVVCYPGLSFLEAAYLYGYFRPQLVKNEYVRLQKIQTLIKEFGR